MTTSPFRAHAIYARGVGVVNVYDCSGCGYRAQVHEGSGFVARNELRHWRATDDLVSVTISVHGHGGRNAPDDLPVGGCPDCGGEDVVEPARIGIRRHVACPRCGGETRRSSAGLWG
jgi:hypothetical protein